MSTLSEAPWVIVRPHCPDLDAWTQGGRMRLSVITVCSTYVLLVSACGSTATGPATTATPEAEVRATLAAQPVATALSPSTNAPSPSVTTAVSSAAPVTSPSAAASPSSSPSPVTVADHPCIHPARENRLSPVRAPASDARWQTWSGSWDGHWTGDGADLPTTFTVGLDQMGWVYLSFAITTQHPDTTTYLALAMSRPSDTEMLDISPGPGGPLDGPVLLRMQPDGMSIRGSTRRGATSLMGSFTRCTLQ